MQSTARRSYTVEQCLDPVAPAGPAFQGWFVKAPHHPRQDFAPRMRMRCGLAGAEIAALAAQAGDRRRAGGTERERCGHELFRTLWRLYLLAVAPNATSCGP